MIKIILFMASKFNFIDLWMRKLIHEYSVKFTVIEVSDDTQSIAKKICLIDIQNINKHGATRVIKQPTRR